ncbi:uncharacterized protein LOC122071487 isoform X2 [Macadamia integrifolia]|uniref:uncharacterized protein LOC122071487 isoform X2 n=1 Tax=Macadamia integrifolia TaxID=60698 RepID=UPI001C4F1511|nr:uncharacterized protein LOC122071487 isoform X2 [Macadamia integrifolia]
MEAEKQSALIILVIWRGKKLNVEMESSDTFKEFGHKLQKLTNVKADTMRFLVPRSMDEGSKLFTPFSDEHSSLSLQEASIHERKPVRMMGVFEEEIEEIKQNAKEDLRIVGFDEGEKRVRQKILDRPQTSLRLPQGTYTFCDFYTLQIPGIELNPPATEALRRMHMLAADPGIIAIMNKHHWRVGIMTEMAPEGYVGISPKCILGYNKNRGEEISLRLRTDDLKGFRKYENIKKTLLHELLNEEAASLDWTRSRICTLSAARPSERHEEEIYVGSSGSTSQKLGGKKPGQLASARASSVAAAYHRLAIASTNCSGGFGDHVEPDPDDSGLIVHEPDPDDSVEESMQVDEPKEAGCNPYFEPDPGDSQRGEAIVSESFQGKKTYRITSEPDPDDCEVVNYAPNIGTGRKLVGSNTCEEPDSDDSVVNGTTKKRGVTVELRMDDAEGNGTLNSEGQLMNSFEEPDPDDCEIKQNILEYGNSDEPDPDDSVKLNKTAEEPDPDDSGTPWEHGSRSGPDPIDSRGNGVMQFEPHPDDTMKISIGSSRMQVDEPDPDDSVKLNKTAEEPDPDDLGSPLEHESRSGPDPIDSRGNGVMQSEPRSDDTMKISMGSSRMQVDEPDPDDSGVKRNILEYGYSDEPDPDDLVKLNKTAEEPDPDDSGTPLEHGSRSGPDPIDSRGNGVMQSEPHPDDTMKISMGSSRIQVDEPDPDDLELQRIQDPVSVVCAHLQKAIEMLQSKVSPTEATTVLQTLFKIIRNVIKHPDEMKFRRLRKANPLFHHNIANYRAAMGILFLVGFNEDVVSDEVGRAETNVALKRNDLGLLWLAKSSLEMCIAY